MAVYTVLTTYDARRIATRWRLGEAKELEGVAKGSVNTNYRLETETGAYFVRLDETRSVSEVEAEARLVGYLARHRFPTPEPMADKSGQRIGSHDDKPLAVFPWLPGRDKPAEKYDRRELLESGITLARLHIASEGFNERIPNRFGRASIAARWARIRGKADLPKGHREEIDAAVASFSREPVPHGPVGVVHGDWFADNLLFEGGRIVGVLDFEAAATDHLAFDVAVAVNALCWLPSSPDRFHPARVEALLEGYRKGNGPAPTDEKSLRYFLRLAALRFTVTRIQDFRLKKSRLRVKKDYRDFLKRLRFWSEQ